MKKIIKIISLLLTLILIVSEFSIVSEAAVKQSKEGKNSITVKWTEKTTDKYYYLGFIEINDEFSDAEAQYIVKKRADKKKIKVKANKRQKTFKNLKEGKRYAVALKYKKNGKYKYSVNIFVYTAPKKIENIGVMKKTNTDITLRWAHQPGCYYEFILYKNVNGQYIKEVEYTGNRLQPIPTVGFKYEKNTEYLLQIRPVRINKKTYTVLGKKVKPYVTGFKSKSYGDYVYKVFDTTKKTIKLKDVNVLELSVIK